MEHTSPLLLKAQWKCMAESWLEAWQWKCWAANNTLGPLSLDPCSWQLVLLSKVTADQKLAYRGRVGNHEIRDASQIVCDTEMFPNFFTQRRQLWGLAITVRFTVRMHSPLFVRCGNCCWSSLHTAWIHFLLVLHCVQNVMYLSISTAFEADTPTWLPQCYVGSGENKFDFNWKKAWRKDKLYIPGLVSSITIWKTSVHVYAYLYRKRHAASTWNCTYIQKCLMGNSCKRERREKKNSEWIFLLSIFEFQVETEKWLKFYNLAQLSQLSREHFQEVVSHKG